MNIMKVKLGEPKIEKRIRVEYGKTWTETWSKHVCFGPRRSHGTTYQMQITINEERTLQEFTDGSIEKSDWKVIEKITKQVNKSKPLTT